MLLVKGYVGNLLMSYKKHERIKTKPKPKGLGFASSLNPEVFSFCY